jgi:hypothetical protein
MDRVFFAHEAAAQLRCGISVVLSRILSRVAFELLVDFRQYAKAPLCDEAMPRDLIDQFLDIVHDGEGQAENHAAC